MRKCIKRSTWRYLPSKKKQKFIEEVESKLTAKARQLKAHQLLERSVWDDCFEVLDGRFKFR